MLTAPNKIKSKAKSMSNISNFHYKPKITMAVKTFDRGKNWKWKQSLSQVWKYSEKCQNNGTTMNIIYEYCMQYTKR